MKSLADIFCRNRPALGISLALLLGTLWLYWPATHHEFIDFDDPDYIINNEHVTSGVSLTNIVWAMQSNHAGNWHPLTWISHMLDCQMFGLNPGWHHLTNMLFHAANSVLLFFWLSRLTGALWRSAFVAALFAWHPLHVESVAWAAERKDVLSAFFWMLTLIAYTAWAQKGRKASYILALIFFALGLMSKPMVVTLPCVLLLLDFWPLQRLSLPENKTSLRDFLRRLGKLFLEKTPFFLLAIAGSAVTFLVQKNGGAFWSATSLGITDRIANAFVSYVRYISKLFWPVDLALIYPHPGHWPTLLVIGAIVFFVVCSLLSLMLMRRSPYLIVGWLWFVGTLVPTIGLVQVGVQSMADRYTYLPSIGLFIIAAWSAADLANRRPVLKKFLPIAAGLALAGCFMATSVQINYWQNSFKIFTRTINVTTDNYPAYNCLGGVLEKMGRKDEAYALYAESVRIKPDYPLGQFNLGMMMLERGQSKEALDHLYIAAQLMPNNADVQYDLGVYFSRHDQPAEALGYFLRALALRPDFPPAKNELGQLLAAHPDLKKPAVLDTPR